MKHGGVLFSNFVCQNIPCRYGDRAVKLNATAEAYVITFLKLKKYHDKTFVKNFASTLAKYVGLDADTADIKRWDFSNFKNAKIRTKKGILDAGTATHNGKRYTYNPNIEPPTVFVGRGLHPRRGCVKPPVRKKDVTLNTSHAREPREWKMIVHVDAPWVAKYNDTLTGEQKYVFLNEHNDDKHKFDNARNLRHRLRALRNKYNRDMRSSNETTRQCATCLAIIDSLCIRVGNEKDADTADTVGCCTLKPKNVTIFSDDVVEFSFLGKDSIPCHKKLKNRLVFENVRDFVRTKRANDAVFDVSPTKLNSYIESIVPGATAKTFRTCHASRLMEEHLRKGGSDVNCFREANMRVAKLLCHVRGDSVSCGTSKMNYIDPRIIFSWCKKNAVPVGRVYSAALEARHSWASDVDENFVY